MSNGDHISAYIYIPYKFFKENIIKDRLKITLADDTNDPMEFEYGGNCDKIVSQQHKNTYGILCFSKTHENSAMWGHYADKHFGVCIEFKFPLQTCHCSLDENIDEIAERDYLLKIDNEYITRASVKQKESYPLMQDVRYREKRVQGTIGDDIQILFKKYKNLHPELSDPEIWKNSIYLRINSSMLSKHLSWEYEKEMRMIINIDELIPEKNKITNKDMYFIDGFNKYISRVLLGVRCEKSEDEVNEFLRKEFPSSEIPPTVKKVEYHKSEHLIYIPEDDQ